jgi:hypothetical protein
MPAACSSRSASQNMSKASVAASLPRPKTLPACRCVRAPKRITRPCNPAEQASQPHAGCAMNGRARQRDALARQHRARGDQRQEPSPSSGAWPMKVVAGAAVATPARSSTRRRAARVRVKSAASAAASRSRRRRRPRSHRGCRERPRALRTLTVPAPARPQTDRRGAPAGAARRQLRPRASADGHAVARAVRRQVLQGGRHGGQKASSRAGGAGGRHRGVKENSPPATAFGVDRGLLSRLLGSAASAARLEEYRCSAKRDSVARVIFQRGPANKVGNIRARVPRIRIVYGAVTVREVGRVGRQRVVRVRVRAVVDLLVLLEDARLRVALDDRRDRGRQSLSPPSTAAQ